MTNISLALLKANEAGTIAEISGGCHARKRLYELGLNKGTHVKMIKNDIGPVILNLSGHKLALGKGLANKIIVNK